MSDDGFTGDDGDQEWLLAQFEYELCAECGLDYHDHRVGPDPLGNRHAWCLRPVPDGLSDEEIDAEMVRRTNTFAGPPWAEREPKGPRDDGDVGGDIQIGTAWGRSWVRTTPGVPDHWSVLSSTYYLAAAPPDSTERFIQQQVERLICTDPNDPGSSEVWSETDHTDLSDTRPATDELAREFSREDSPDDLGWDGREGFPHVRCTGG